MYWCKFVRESEKKWFGEEEFLIEPYKLNNEEDVYAFTAPRVIFDKDLAKEDVKKINVFPNPYYGSNSQENSQIESFVTFNHLPQKVVIRIFNLAGQHIRTLHKDDESQFLRWDLLNENNFRVARGLYIIYIDMPELGTSKILKLALIQRNI